MGIFKKLFHSENGGTDALTLLEKHEKGELDDTEFLRLFGKAEVFHSTPAGDHKDGGSRLFILPETEESGFLPVFSSAKRMEEFFKKEGRLGHIIVKRSFRAVLETADKINNDNAPIKMGVVIDPGYYGITVSASNLPVVIDMTK